jgi:hypothetical protein
MILIFDGGSGWQVLCPDSIYKKHDIVVYSGIYPLTEGITFIWFWYFFNKKAIQNNIVIRSLWY